MVKTMDKKKIVLLLILIFFISGCNKKQLAEDLASKSDNLTVYTMEPDFYIDQAIMNFQKDYPDIHVEVQKIPYDNLEEQRTAIATEFMAGDGGDLYLNADDYFDDLYVSDE